MSDSDHDEEFAKTEGGSHTYPCDAGSLKQGGHVVINGHPCKITEISVAKTGKHGHSKATIVGVDIFTNRKYEDQRPSSHTMQVPNITKTDYQVVACDDNNYLTLMLDGEFRSDLQLPDKDEHSWVADFKKDYDAKKSLVVTVVTALGEDRIVDFKMDKEK